MLSFFRQNHFLRSLFLLVYTVILKLPLFFYPFDKPAGGGFCGDWLLSLINHRTTSVTLAILLTFFSAVYLNKIIIENRITRESTLFPGVFLVLITSSIPELSITSAPLLGLLPFLIVLDYLMLLYKQSSYAGKMFNIGLWLSVASLFYFPYIYFAIFILIGVSILKYVKTLDILRMILGLITPFLFVLYYLIWHHRADEFFTVLFDNYFGRFGIPLDISFESGLKIVLIAVLLFFGVLNFRQFIKKKNVQAVNKIDVIYWGAVISGLTLFVATPLAITQIILLLPFLSVMTAMQFINIQNTVVVEVLHLALLGYGFYLHYITFV